MMLVFLFCILLLLISLLIFLIVLSTLKITVDNLFITNMNKQADKKIIKDFCINFELFLFGKIKIFRSKITDKKLEKINRKLNIKNKIKNFDLKKLKGNLKLNKDTKKLLKKVDIFKISIFNLNLEIGTEDVIFTSFLITTISTLISIILSRTLKKEGKENSKYQILPIYYNQNLIKMDLDCIISIKIVHIIFIIFNLLKNGKVKKGRVNKNGGTSNRRTYDYSYE